MLDDGSGRPYFEEPENRMQLPPATNPPPTVDGNGNIQANVSTVYGLGQQMRGENETLAPRLEAIRKNFQMDENNYRSAEFPVARGLAQVSPTVQTALYTQDTAIWSAGWVVESHVEGNKAMANISMKIASEFDSVDDLNSADLERIREVTGIYPPEPVDPRIHRNMI